MWKKVDPRALGKWQNDVDLQVMQVQRHMCTHFLAYIHTHSEAYWYNCFVDSCLCLEQGLEFLCGYVFHLFDQEIFTESLLWADYYCGCRTYRSEHNRQSPCPFGAQLLVLLQHICVFSPQGWAVIDSGSFLQVCFRHLYSKQNYRLVSWNESMRIFNQNLYFRSGEIKAKRMLCLKTTPGWCRSTPRSPVKHVGHITTITPSPVTSSTPPADLPTHFYFLCSWVGLRVGFKIPDTLLFDDRVWNA